MRLSMVLDRFQCLVDFLGQVGQVLGTDRLDNDLLLIAQCERLSKISVCQGCLGLLEQCLAKLIADHRGRKEAMETIALRNRPLKTE